MRGYSTLSSALSINLFWQYEDGDEPVGDIERSEAPHEGFETIATGVDLTAGTYQDNFRHRTKTGFTIIGLVDTS